MYVNDVYNKSKCSSVYKLIVDILRLLWIAMLRVHKQ